MRTVIDLALAEHAALRDGDTALAERLRAQRWGAAFLRDPHGRECASAAIAARLEKAKTPAEKREWRKLRRDMLGR